MSMVLILCDDLMFTSKVTATARALQLESRVVRTCGTALKMLGVGNVGCMIVDLHQPNLMITELVTEVRALSPQTLMIGFGSHVDHEILKAARLAGVDVVQPRSRFVEQLEANLPTWVKGLA